MVADLLIAAAATLALLIFVMWCGYEVSCRHTRFSDYLALLLAVAALFVETYYAGRLFWAAWIPISAALVWSNWTPVLLALGCGVALGNTRQGNWKIAAVLGTASLVVWAYPISRPWLRPISTWGSAEWSQGVCLQSTEYSCGPSSVATLLHDRGILSTERQLARLCLTGKDGTSALGIYRGLSCATDKTSQTAMVFNGSFDEFVTSRSYPAVVLVSFPDDAPLLFKALRSLSGRRHGEGHAVVVFGPGENAGEWQIGDPATGRDRWREADLRKRWTGDAIYLSGNPIKQSVCSSNAPLRSHRDQMNP